MSLKEQLASGKFVVIAELQPPKGNQVSELMEHAEHLRSRVDAFSVPDLQNAIMRLGSLSVCTLLKGKDLTRIFNLSCRHRNRLALQSDLLMPLPWALRIFSSSRETILLSGSLRSEVCPGFRPSRSVGSSQTVSRGMGSRGA